MPMGIESPVLVSCSWRLVIVVWLLVVLQRMEPEASSGAPSTTPSIKLRFAAPFKIWQSVVSPSSPAGHGGEGNWDGLAKTCRSGRGQGKELQSGDSHMVAFIATMIFGRWSGLSMVLLLRHLFNLLWRPYTKRSALALHFSSIPSGRFPGDEGEGRRRATRPFEASSLSPSGVGPPPFWSSIDAGRPIWNRRWIGRDKTWRSQVDCRTQANATRQLLKGAIGEAKPRESRAASSPVGFPLPSHARASSQRSRHGRRRLRGGPPPRVRQGQRPPRQALPQARPQGVHQGGGADGDRVRRHGLRRLLRQAHLHPHQQHHRRLRLGWRLYRMACMGIIVQH